MEKETDKKKPSHIFKQDDMVKITITNRVNEWDKGQAEFVIMMPYSEFKSLIYEICDKRYVKKVDCRPCPL